MAIKKDKVTKVFAQKKSKSSKKPSKLLGIVFAVGGYFKGSWTELKLVRWPNRRSTLGMTAAVLLFAGLFLALIMALDAIFSQLFNLIIK